MLVVEVAMRSELELGRTSSHRRVDTARRLLRRGAGIANEMVRNIYHPFGVLRFVLALTRTVVTVSFFQDTFEAGTRSRLHAGHITS